MSWYRILLRRRFWLSALVTVVGMALLCALGAWAVVGGVLPMECSRGWMLASWSVGALAGGRVLHGGREGSLGKALLLGAVVYGLVGLLSQGEGSGLGGHLWWQVGLALLIGSVLSALPGPGKRALRRRSSNDHSRRPEK